MLGVWIVASLYVRVATRQFTTRAPGETINEQRTRVGKNLRAREGNTSWSKKSIKLNEEPTTTITSPRLPLEHLKSKSAHIIRRPITSWGRRARGIRIHRTHSRTSQRDDTLLLGILLVGLSKEQNKFKMWLINQAQGEELHQAGTLQGKKKKAKTRFLLNTLVRNSYSKFLINSDL